MNRFAALDGLRGVSAIAVVLFHLPLAMHAYGSPLVREAYIFVDFFFVLSGFVIAHAYAARIETVASVGDFLLRRVARRWPLHLATLAGLVVLECARVLSTGAAGTRPPPRPARPPPHADAPPRTANPGATPPALIGTHPATSPPPLRHGR